MILKTVNKTTARILSLLALAGMPLIAAAHPGHVESGLLHEAAHLVWLLGGLFCSAAVAVWVMKSRRGIAARTRRD